MRKTVKKLTNEELLEVYFSTHEYLFRLNSTALNKIIYYIQKEMDKRDMLIR